jgi:hypothetical protein
MSSGGFGPARSVRPAFMLGIFVPVHLCPSLSLAIVQSSIALSMHATIDLDLFLASLFLYYIVSIVLALRG